MRSRHVLFLGLAGVLGASIACKDGDDDEDGTKADGSASLHDAGKGGTGTGTGTGTPDATVSGGDGSTGTGTGTGTGTDGGAEAGSTFQIPPPPAKCNGTVTSADKGGRAPTAAPAVTLPDGFEIEVIAEAPKARELVALPNGDLLVGTNTEAVYLVTNADAADVSVNPGTATVFATTPEGTAQGIGYDTVNCNVYISTEHDLFEIPYVDAQTTGPVGSPVATFRAVPPDPKTDGDVHTTTSVAAADGNLYLGIGSGCNACVENDPTRATVQELQLDGGAMTTRATRFRNAIGLAQNPFTGTLWAGGAGQDEDGVPSTGHPYEFFDAVSLHAKTADGGIADYGWPFCEEDHVAFVDGSVCSNETVPLVEMPAYQTIIGAAFYPTTTAQHAFPASYQGGLFLTGHGSWHTEPDGSLYTPPRVAFVPMNGDSPVTAVDWQDPTKQWTEFIGGWQLSDGHTRLGTPTGVAVGPRGTLFVADDANGVVYRIRPTLP